MAYFIWGVLYLLVGTILFLVGAIEWKPWENPLKSNKKKRAIIFAGAIALSGLSMTKGWNEFTAYSQKQGEIAFNRSLEETNRRFKQDLDERDQKFKADQKERELQLRKDQKRALIVSLAREWLLNEIYELSKPFSFDANDPNLGKEHYMYQQFRTSAQDRILTSELFDLKDQKDKELLLAVAHYESAIKYFNTLIAWANESCAKFPENVGQQKRKEVYLLIRDKAPLYIDFKRFHKELLKLLVKEYSWALDEARPMLVNIQNQTYRLQE